jgi:hypothetical protein
MNFTIFIFIFFCAILIKIIYEAYSIHKLITFDENCYSLKKIIVDKININSYHDNNFYINSQTNIGKFIQENYKCFFYEMNPNSHYVNNEIKSEIVFKCYC